MNDRQLIATHPILSFSERSFFLHDIASPRHPSNSRAIVWFHGHGPCPDPRAYQYVFLAPTFNAYPFKILSYPDQSAWTYCSVVDTHPTSLASLRIDQPFPELLAHVKSIDFDSLDSMDHGNIPFVIILIKALEDWKATVSF